MSKLILTVVAGCFYMLCSTLLVAQDQQYLIKGSITDSAGSALPGATITVSAADRKWTAVAKGTGAFEVGVGKSGNYTLEVSHIGYKKYILKSLVFHESTVLDVGAIALIREANTHRQVVVVGKKPVMELQAGKSIYNVQSDPLATGKQVNEILENLPGVSVNSSGNISVNGTSEIIVMINNKISRMNYNDVLRQLPAAAIERIELIQGASPKYAASGAEYILNIITVKQSGKRKAGSLSASAASNTMANSMFMYNSSQGKSGYYTRFSYGYNQMPHLKWYDRERLTSNRTFFAMDGYNSMKHGMGNVIIGTDQYLDSASVLSIEYGLNLHWDKFTGNSAYISYDTILDKAEGFANSVRTNPKEIENNLSANYQRKLTRKSFLETELYYSIYNQTNNRTSPLASTNVASIFKSYNVNFNAEIRIDKTPRLQYQAGAAYRRVSINNQLKTYSATSYSVLDVQNYVDAIGVYASTTFGIGKGSLSLGLRAEQLSLQSRERRDISKDTSFRLLSLYPSIFYKRALGDRVSMNFSFSRKVVYPEVHFVFNSPNQADDFDLWNGNSLLVPAIMSRVQLDVTARKNKNACTFSGFYTHTSNSFARIQFFEGGVRNQQFVNLSVRRSYGLSGNLNLSSFKWLSTRINSSFSFNHYAVQEHQWIRFADTYSISGSITNLATFSPKWSFENAVRLVNVSRSIYEEVNPVVNLTAQLNFKPRGNDKIVFSLFGHDLLNQMRFQTTNFLAPDIVQTGSERGKWTRFVRLNFNYKFGQDVKPREKKIQQEKVNYIQG
ncbi:MAG TPA: TonB-dependent receptor [Chitinophagaceae bacterium]|nr:TonB-dependent receptor [Chitinophagaceae bacterium]